MNQLLEDWNEYPGSKGHHKEEKALCGFETADVLL